VSKDQVWLAISLVAADSDDALLAVVRSVEAMACVLKRHVCLVPSAAKAGRLDASLLAPRLVVLLGMRGWAVQREGRLQAGLLQLFQDVEATATATVMTGKLVTGAASLNRPEPDPRTPDAPDPVVLQLRASTRGDGDVDSALRLQALLPQMQEDAPRGKGRGNIRQRKSVVDEPSDAEESSITTDSKPKRHRDRQGWFAGRASSAADRSAAARTCKANSRKRDADTDSVFDDASWVSSLPAPRKRVRKATSHKADVAVVWVDAAALEAKKAAAAASKAQKRPRAKSARPDWWDSSLLPWSVIGSVFEVPDGRTAPYRGCVVDVHRDKAVVTLPAAGVSTAPRLEPGTLVDGYWKSGQVAFSATIKRRHADGTYAVNYTDGASEDGVSARDLAPPPPTMPPRLDDACLPIGALVELKDDDDPAGDDLLRLDQQLRGISVPTCSHRGAAARRNSTATATWRVEEVIWCRGGAEGARQYRVVQRRDAAVQRIVDASLVAPRFVVRYDGGFDGQELLSLESLTTLLRRATLGWRVDRSQRNARWACSDVGAKRSSLDFYLGQRDEKRNDEADAGGEVWNYVSGASSSQHPLIRDWEPTIGHAAQCRWKNGRYYLACVSAIFVDAETGLAQYDVDFSDARAAEPQVGRNNLKPALTTSASSALTLHAAAAFGLLLGKFDTRISKGHAPKKLSHVQVYSLNTLQPSPFWLPVTDLSLVDHDAS